MRNTKFTASFLLPFILLAGGCFLAGCNKEDNASVPVAEKDAALPADTAKTPSSDVFLEVYGTRLTQAELDMEVNRMLAAQGMGNLPPDISSQARAELASELVDRFITERVLSHEVEIQKINVDTNELQEAVETIVANLPEGVSLQTALANYGMTEIQFQKQISEDLKIRKLLGALTEDVGESTPAEIEDFYKDSPDYFRVPESVRVRHILVKSEEGADAAVSAAKQKRAEEVRGKLLAGGDFAALAKEYSDCPSAAIGGDLGAMTQGKAVPEFETAAFAQAVNEIGPLVKTEFGYHIIQVTEHTEASVQPLEEVRANISLYLDNQKRQDRVRDYVDGLREKADIQYHGGMPPAGQ